ncbi:hypothetical protein PGTUg99_011291 [Puccinia graminis f. sp. tritici]|uniref:Uncharacterized protein n=1 Tax=Puccinia graminis f. sp. tritici TaxID=56615 RepID=A0A5B0RTR8_PUCGR|nr:hypothetical protein PGTUg99_011291 [Puccinia graminis f. sp. tritici]
MSSTQPSSQLRSALKCPIPSRHSIRNVSVPSHYKRRQSSNRVRFEGHSSSNGSQNESLRNHPHASSSRDQRPNLAQPGPSRIPCRVQSGSLSSRRTERSQTSERGRQIQQNNTYNHVQAQRPRISISPVERTRISPRRHQTAKISLFIPSHSRAALSPCLSLPSKINSSISTLKSGGCEILLQKLHRPVALGSQTEVQDLSLKIGKKAYTLSPSWCSPNIQNVAYKYNVSCSKNQEANNQILSAFLKNNGGYLDDSDDEEEEEHDDDEPVNSLRSTVAFLKRIPYPFESRNPTPMPSAQFNDLSLLSISTSESSGKSSPNSSPRFYWNRAQPNVSASPSKTRSRFSIYKT